MSKRKRFLYVFTSNFDHHGINVKVDGHRRILNKYFKLTFIHLPYERNSFWLKKAILTLFFEINAIFSSIFHQKLFVRYNPKMPLSTLWFCFLSFFKPIFFEHNNLLLNELIHTKKTVQANLHRFLLTIMKHSDITHFCIDSQIRQSFLDRGFKEKRTITMQNAYLKPEVKEEDSDQVLIQDIKSWKTDGKKLAIFTGNKHPWQGIDRILKLLGSRQDVQCIIVGNFNVVDTPEHIRFLGPQSPATLLELYLLCDFGISCFALDVIGGTHASPLKSREYLCNGLPVLTHYIDEASNIPELAPAIFNAQNNEQNALENILIQTIDKKNLAQTAQKLLSCEVLWREFIFD